VSFYQNHHKNYFEAKMAQKEVYMTTQTTPKHVHANVLIRTAKDDLPNALRALAQRLEQEEGIPSASIPNTHFAAGSSFVEGNDLAFAIVTIVEDVEV
jgi:hypothetical protein